MKKCLCLAFTISLWLPLLVGCGQVQEKDSGKVPTEVKEAERKDSTRLDPARTEPAMSPVVEDTAGQPRDSL
jgi:hypothetical protein